MTLPQTRSEIEDGTLRTLYSCSSFIDSKDSSTSLRDPEMSSTMLLTTKKKEPMTYSEMFQNWITGYWWYTTPSLVEDAENAILCNLQNPYETFEVDLGPIFKATTSNNHCSIWTLVMNRSSPEIPIVLVHGFAAGIALWVKNLDELAKWRPVYAFDLLGFGRSSRPHFSSDPAIAEEQYVESIEAWCDKMNLDRIILLGHSFGAFLSTAYTLKYPDRIEHLIIADPWGFNEKPENLDDITRIPVHHRILVKIFKPLNPLWLVRLAGPLGPTLLRMIKQDIIGCFIGSFEQPGHKIAWYIYHCNVQTPTGESAFHALMYLFGWAKNPVGCRLIDLNPDIPLTTIYGSKSWVDHFDPERIKQMRPSDSYTMHFIVPAGHHVYAGKASLFNLLVSQACCVRKSGSDPRCFEKTLT